MGLAELHSPRLSPHPRNFLVVLLHSSFLIFFLLLSIQRLFLHIIPNGLVVTLPDVPVAGCSVGAIIVLGSHNNLVGDQEGRVEPQNWPMRLLPYQQPAKEAPWSLSRNSGGAAIRDCFQIFIRSSWVMQIPVTLMCPVSLVSLTTLLILDQKFWKLSPN